MNVNKLEKEGIDKYKGYGSGSDSMCGEIEKFLKGNGDNGYSIDELCKEFKIKKLILGRSVYRLFYKGRVKRKFVDNVGYYYIWLKGGNGIDVLGSSKYDKGIKGDISLLFFFI